MNPYPRRAFLPIQHMNMNTHYSFSFNGYHHSRSANPDMYYTRTHQHPMQFVHESRKWSVNDDEVFILDNFDMYPPPPLSSFSAPRHQPPLQFVGGGHRRQSEVIDEALVLENVDIDESFFRHGGLTKEVISKNLKLKQINCHEEEEEYDGICVICQVGFERKETIGVLECKHRYHVECIKEWLFRKNVCPLCKVQAFNCVKSF